MKLNSCASAIAALTIAASSLLSPRFALAANASAITAGSYCIVSEAQGFGKTLPVFGNASSCQWKSTPAPSVTGGKAQLSFSPDLSGLPPGTHTLYLRFQDDQGVWGPPRRERIKVVGDAPKTLATAKYFIDTDGDPSQAGTEVSSGTLLGKEGIPLTLPSSVKPGLHTLYLHVRDSAAVWGPGRKLTFSVAQAPTIAAARYFISPGDLLPAAYLAAADPTSLINLTTLGGQLTGAFGSGSVAISQATPLTQPAGVYTVYAMFQDSNGSWSKGWGDAVPAPQAPLYVGHSLTLTITDSAGKQGGKDGSVQILASAWNTDYSTPARSCTVACSDIYPNGAVVTLKATPQPWIDKAPVWSGCAVQTDGTCQVTMDAARNVGVSFVDTTPPNTAITSTPGSLANKSTATFGFALATTSVEDAAAVTFQCLTDGDPTNSAAFAPCSSPKSVTALGNGTHTFYVRAVDKASNRDATPASYSWTVDTVPPVTTAEVGGSVQTGDLVVTLKSNEAADIYFTLDGSAPSTAGTPHPSGTAIEITGDTLLTFFARDRAGNNEGVRSKRYVTAYDISLSMPGAAQGSITIAPAGEALTDPTTITVPAGTNQTLQALPKNEFSLFTGWGNACTGTGACVLNLPVELSGSATKQVTATFDYKDLSTSVLTESQYFSSPEGAYAATTDGVISMWAVPFTLDLVADRPITVYLHGGRDSTFSTVIDRTTLKGRLDIRDGKVIVDHFAVQ